MSCINIIGKMVKADEEKSEIKRKLEEIRKIRTSFNIDVSRFRKMIDRDKLNQEEIERENEKYKIIAKLSFDLFMDYEYYREFPIKNDSQFTNCAEELESLGYELRESAEWVNVRRPNMDTIIDQIFLSHLCQSILTRCVCCDAITRDGQSECDNCLNESNEKRIKTTAEKDDKIKYESLIPLNRSFEDKCTNCYNYGSNKEIIGERMCGDCYSSRCNDWICSYRKCGMTNIGCDKYCKSCGIERSSVLTADIPLWRCKNHIRDRILICGKCELINEIDKNVYCKCKGTADRSSESLDNLRNDHRQNETNFSNGENNQSNIDRKNKCQCGTIKPQNQSICENCRNLSNDHGFSVFNESWVCGKCGANNQIIKDKFCWRCGVKKDKTVEIRNQNEFDGKQETIRVSDKVNIQSNIDQKSQWKCDCCEMINDVAFLSCRCCSWARAVIWTCSCCSKENEESVQQCGACGFTNENAEKKLCVRCRQKESIVNELCAQCLSDREYDWQCLYRNCLRRNSSKDNYCRECGLHRYIVLEHGAPNWRLKNGYRERIWICFSCWTINKWSNERCTKYFVWCQAERDKFAKWCKSCGSQNRRSDIKCSRCKQSL